MRATINRNRSTALRGGDPDQLKDVQSYIAVKFRDAGQLDFQGVPGSQGQDTTWAQVGQQPSVSTGSGCFAPGNVVHKWLHLHTHPGEWFMSAAQVCGLQAGSCRVCCERPQQRLVGQLQVVAVADEALWEYRWHRGGGALQGPAYVFHVCTKSVADPAQLPTLTAAAAGLLLAPCHPLQLFFALRAGWTDTARRAAAACSDVSLVRGGPGSLGRWLEEFLTDRSAFRAASGGHLQQQCERLLAAQRQVGGAHALGGVSRGGGSCGWWQEGGYAAGCSDW
jgi:hypothetical protein